MVLGNYEEQEIFKSTIDHSWSYGPFSVLAENIYSLCIDSFQVGKSLQLVNALIANNLPGGFPSSYGMVSHPCRLDALLAGHIQCT